MLCLLPRQLLQRAALPVLGKGSEARTVPWLLSRSSHELFFSTSFKLSRPAFHPRGAGRCTASPERRGLPRGPGSVGSVSETASGGGRGWAELRMRGRGAASPCSECPPTLPVWRSHAGEPGPRGSVYPRSAVQQGRWGTSPLAIHLRPGKAGARDHRQLRGRCQKPGATERGFVPPIRHLTCPTSTLSDPRRNPQPPTAVMGCPPTAAGSGEDVAADGIHDCSGMQQDGTLMPPPNAPYRCNRVWPGVPKSPRTWVWRTL